MTTFNVANLAQIETHLSSNAYLSGGAFPNQEDVKIFTQLKGVPNKKTSPAVYHWYNFMSLFAPAVRDAWAGKIPVAEAKKEVKEAKHVKTQHVDKNAEKPAEKVAEKIAEKGDQKPAEGAKGKKPKPVAKSVLIFDVKVYEKQTNLDELSKKIYDLEIDGLVWTKTPKILPVAYGINKLQIACVIEDDKVSTEDLFQKIEQWEEVQSTDVVTMQKN